MLPKPWRLIIWKMRSYCLLQQHKNQLNYEVCFIKQLYVYLLIYLYLQHFIQEHVKMSQLPDNTMFLPLEKSVLFDNIQLEFRLVRGSATHCQ